MIEIGTEIDPGLAAIDLQGYGCESFPTVRFQVPLHFNIIRTGCMDKDQIHPANRIREHIVVYLV